jgi:hypothetical protein
MFPVALIAALTLHQSLPNPTWVTAVIKFGKNYNFIVDDSIIYGEWEPLRKLAVVGKNELVNAAGVC